MTEYSHSRVCVLCRQLLEHPQLDVLAVDPVQEMNEELQRNLPQIKAVLGSATDIPVEDASLDAVFVAQVQVFSFGSSFY